MTSGNVVFEIAVTGAPFINGFAVVLSYNIAVLNATTPLDYSSNVLNAAGTPVVVRNCVNGRGPFCVQDQDGLGTVSLGLVLQGTATVAPTSGTLFKVTLDIIGKGLSEIHIVSATLTNGLSQSAVPSDTSDGYFTNLDCPIGSGRLCTPPTADFTFSPQAGSAGIPVAFNSSASRSTNPQGVIKNYSWRWGDPFSVSPTNTTSPLVQHLFTIPNNYTVTLTATDNFGVSASKTSMVQVVPLPPLADFTILGGGTELDTNPGVPVSSTITLLSISGFAGQVSLSTAVYPASGLTLSLSPLSLSLSANKNANASLQVVAGGPGNFQLFITGTSGNVVHSIILIVQVISDIRVLISTVSLKVFPGSSAAATVTVVGRGGPGFAEIVQLSSHISPPLSNGPTASLSPTSVILKSSGSNTSIVTVSTNANTAPGNYVLTVTGTRGLSSSSNYVSIEVLPAPPLFAQLQWRERVPVTDNGGVQTFVVGVVNPNVAVTFYARIQVSIISDTGTRILFVSSVVLQLLPGQTLSDIPLTVALNSGDVGHSFTFTSIIHWGKTPTDLSATSTQVSDIGMEDLNGSNQAAGAFTVVGIPAKSEK